MTTPTGPEMVRSSGTMLVNKTGSWRFLRPRYQDKTAPCAEACPAGADIACAQLLAGRGDFEQAWLRLREENPLTGVCGCVCFHPCESACNRGEYDEPVAINAIERFLADRARRADALPPVADAAPSGKRVAVVGAGPAGITAAHFLGRSGHEVDLYDAREEPGGLLRYAIPGYRLPLPLLQWELALALGEEGFRLALVGRNADRLQSTADNVPEALLIAADLSEPDAALVVVDRTLDKWGRVDVLVNNAGVAALVPIDETTDTLLDDTFAINTFAPIRLVAGVWPVFRRQESGCVVNVSSIAVTDPFPGFSVYAASKGAVDALTRSVINEGRVYGIRAFSVAPGAVETPMLRENFSAQAIPPTATLDPRDVARVVVDCIQGRREADLGQTVLLPSP